MISIMDLRYASQVQALLSNIIALPAKERLATDKGCSLFGLFVADKETQEKTADVTTIPYSKSVPNHPPNT